MIKNILYLHGFRSSPLSTKAQIMEKHIINYYPHINWWCPQLPPSPRQACNLIANGIENWQAKNTAIIGSSLGGFYATWLAEQKGCKAVLLNPSIDPYNSLKDHVGELSTWQNPNDKFEFCQDYVDELHDFYINKLTKPENYFAIIAKGDEVLDWRSSANYYANAQIKLLPKSDHGLSDFEDHLDEIINFLNLKN